MTPQEKIAIFHAYNGANVKFMDIDNIVKVATMDGIVKETVHLGIPCTLISLPIEHKFISVEHCHLLLTDISLITDEHAKEIAKMFSWFNHYNGKEIEAYKNQFGKIVVSNKERISKYETVCLDFDNPELLNQQQIDYLRSKGYNIGYGKYTAQDLVNEGVVIYNQENKGI